MYSLIRPLLFRLDPERAHNIVMSTLAALSGSAMAMRGMRARQRPPDTGPVTLMGLAAANGIGLAAGLDKHARAFPALRALGFGWVEAGTVTPRPQPGNHRPRLFRLERDRALINRMGFNSCGVERFVANLAPRLQRYDSILGVNIGKNAETPLEHAEDDYMHALEQVYPYADYVTVNISSPNTRSLRELQQVDRLKVFIDSLLQKRDALAAAGGQRLPIALKLSPDLGDNELPPLCGLLRDSGIDGVIATNTTVSRPPGLRSDAREEAGGLSGRPLEPLATRTVASLCEHLAGSIPVIGAGGVEDAETARRKLSAGACALQCYTAFIYQGPAVIQRIQQSAAGGPPAHTAGRPDPGRPRRAP